MSKEPKAEIAGSYRVVKVETLHEREDNPNRQSKFIFSKLIDSIRANGFSDPVIVRTVKDGYEILGGAHRVRAAVKLHMTEVPIIDLGKVGDLRARQLLITLNETRGASDQDALAALVQGLRTDGGDEAVQLLPFNDAQLADLLDDLGDDNLPDEQAEPPPEDERAEKIRATDVGLAVLELEGLKQAQLSQILREFRKWRARKEPDIPAWEHLITLIKQDR